MQPIFFSFASGLHYRKTVKLYFRSILPFDLVVSIYENMPFRLFSSFLTAGNKSKCGTLQRLTGSQQSTDKPIFRPVSPPKRQVMQGKSLSCRRYTLELLPTCENIGLQSRLRKKGLQTHLHPRCSQALPQAPPSAPRTHLQPRPRHSPRHSPKSHVIPPGPHSPTARKPRNINDLISKPETPSGELRAKLLSTCHGGTSRSPPRGLADTTQHRRRRRCGGRRRDRRARAGFEARRRTK